MNNLTINKCKINGHSSDIKLKTLYLLYRFYLINKSYEECKHTNKCKYIYARARV